MNFPVHHFLGAQRNGVNLVAMLLKDFNRATGPVLGTDYPVTSETLLYWLRTKHVRSVRVMFTWEAVQSALGGPIPGPANYLNYWNELTCLVVRLIARDIYVSLSPWQYNTASNDTDIVYDDAAFTDGQFASFWATLAVAINAVTGHDQRVAFDLINEPHTHLESQNKPGDIGIELGPWFADAQAVIDAVRGTGATNTIFVPGMAYTAASSFTTNGSAPAWLGLHDPLGNMAISLHCYTGVGSNSPTVLRDACQGAVDFARSNGLKVQIGEIAIDAGPNGRPVYCSTFPLAQAQWDDWNMFCRVSDDVIVGWNWWAISAAGWWAQGDHCDATEGYHWGLTLDDGNTQTVYMDLIQSSLPSPQLYLRDNSADGGAEENRTSQIGWESPDIWVRQNDDGVGVGEQIVGGQPAVVYVKITNRGDGGYAAAGTDVVTVYWAKAATGLAWPAPWDGSDPMLGGTIGAPTPIGVLPAGQSTALAIPWPTTPDPADYGGDGHFCLLASITKPSAPAFDGFPSASLNTSVLALSRVAWRNIHILSSDAINLGVLVMINAFDEAMTAFVTFEVLDGWSRPIHDPEPRLMIRPRDEAIDRLLHTGAAHFATTDDRTFRVLDPARGIPAVELQPRERLEFELAYEAPDGTAGFAVRVTQVAEQGGVQTIIGGQTFVAGTVGGVTDDGRRFGQAAVPKHLDGETSEQGGRGR